MVSCFFCRHFDPDDTGLPVCALRRRLVSGGRACDDFERLFGRDS